MSGRVSNLETVHPAIRRAVEQVQSDLAAQGLPFALYETFRGRDRQESGKSRGTSKAGMWESYHNYGTAVDFVGRTPSGQWSWDQSLPWTRLGEIYERAGLGWGGRWKGFVDLVHGQLSRAYSWQELRNGAVADPLLARNGGATAAEWGAWMRWFWPQAPELHHAMIAQLQRSTGLASNNPEELIQAGERVIGGGNLALRSSFPSTKVMVLAGAGVLLLTSLGFVVWRLRRGRTT